MLLLSIFFLFVLYLLALAFVILTPTELNAALQEKSWIEGGYAADAGLEEVLAHMEWQLSQGNEPATGTDVAAGEMGDWTWTVNVEADTSTQTGNPVHSYAITSTASLLGTPRRILRIKVLQDTFSRFSAYANDTGSVVWVVNNTPTSGPVHCNTQIKIGVPSSWYTTASGPAFLGTVSQAVVGYRPSTSADGIQYTDQYLNEDDTLAPYNGTTPADIANRYAKLYKEGRAGVVTGVKPIEMPPDNGGAKKAAWGGTNFPTSCDNAVYVNGASSSNSGIYVNGDAKVTFSVSRGNPVASIVCGGKTWTVTECRQAAYGNGTVGQTVVEGGSTPAVFTGFPNGSIFAAGDVKELSGTYQGRYTVSADVANGKSVYITNNVLRSGAAGESSLGIVGENVYIGRNAPRILDIYAAVYAGRKKSDGSFVGSMTLENPRMFEMDSGTPPPTLTVHGGQSEAVAGATASVGSGGYHAGYTAGSVDYDPTLATQPPPFFPTYPKLRLSYYEELAP